MPRVVVRVGFGGGGGGAGTITEITSLDSSVTITNPTGPSVDLSVPPSAGDVSSVSGAGAIDVSPTTGATVVSLDQTALQNGGAQEISVAGLSGLLADAQLVEVSKAGTLIGTRKRVNLIEGTGVTLTVADNSGAGRVDVTVNASGSVVREPVQCFYWYPVTPGLLDQEWEGISVLPTGWTLARRSGAGVWTTLATAGGTSAAGDVDPQTPPAVGDCRLSFNRRRSWLLIQPGPFAPSADQYHLYRQLLPSVGVQYHLRTRMNTAYNFEATAGAPTGSGTLQFIMVHEDVSNPGRPDQGSVSTHGIYWRPGRASAIGKASGAATWGMRNVNGGTPSYDYLGTGPINYFGNVPDYEFIYSSQVTNGVNSKQWIRNDSQAMFVGEGDDHLNTALTLGNPVFVDYQMNSGDGLQIFGIDYLRELSGLWDGS